MSQEQYDFGMIGLGVMGRNFLLNVADNGFSAIGLDLDQEKTQALETEAEGRTIKGTTDMATFVSLLKKPRRIMLLVPAGKVVDAVSNDLLPHLDRGDLIIDGGNSHFPDTDRRIPDFAEKGIHFLGVGVSGGAKGARFGPSIMPGGNQEAYEIVRPVLEAVAAKVNGEPCVAYMGGSSAGHYVKMVHNGIEYGMMQLIAEAYDLLQGIAGLSNEELHLVFDKWNKGRLRSFLIEITAAIFAQPDELGEGSLVDKILDKAKQKGTGKWTSQNAMDLGIPLPTIDAAVTMRGLSALKKERVALGDKYPHYTPEDDSVEVEEVIEQVEEALYFAFIMTYAQGLALLADASVEHNYDLNLAEIAKIWRGGCIIRADMLELIRQAYASEPELINIIGSEVFRKAITDTQTGARKAIKMGIDRAIPTMALSAALSYFDAYRDERLPLNLVQAQRDHFGSHTYERTDREGIFHTDWK